MQSSGRSSTVEPPVVVPPSQPLIASDQVEPPVVALLADTNLLNAGPDAPAQLVSLSPPLLSATAEIPQAQIPQAHRALWKKLVWYWPASAASGVWNLCSLTVLLAAVAAIPIVQLVSLGYLLRAAANLSAGQSWRTALPGAQLAGRIVTFAMLAAVMWLPVWLVTDLSYSVQLLRPGTVQSAAWRVAAFLVASAWLMWVTWAAMRGGRWWHMLWPQSFRFVREIWRPATWSRAADNLWSLFERTRSIELWWLGLRAATGALLWLFVPASLMIIGLRADQLKIAGLVGFVGAISLTWVMLFLPFLQILMAERNRFAEIFNVREVRRRFRHAPLAMGLSLIMLFALAIPLYLLRIEATPDELTWLPSLFCVALMFPSKLALGSALGYAARRTRPRHFVLRWSARLLCFAASLAYVGTLYVAQFVAWQGIYIMYFQHAVLVPVAN